MQITPVNYNYTNQKAQKNNQQSFGMAATQALQDFWAANKGQLAIRYRANQAINIMQSMTDIEHHPSIIVDYNGQALIVSKPGQPSKEIPVKSLATIEEAANELWT